MSALAFSGECKNDLDHRIGLEIRTVDLVAEERGTPYVRLPVLLCALHMDHAYLGGAKRFSFHMQLFERKLKWGERWPC